MRVIHVDPPGLPTNPAFSWAARVPAGADTVYVGGQNGIGPDGVVVGAGAGTPPPTVTVAFVAGLAVPGVVVEIEATAVLLP